MQLITPTHALLATGSILPLVLMFLHKEDDRSYLGKIYLDYERMMYARAYHILHSQVDAEDAIHDAIVRLAKKIDVLRALPCNVLGSYLVSTIEHVAINMANKRQTESKHAFKAEGVVLDSVPTGDPTPEEAFIAAGETDALYRALNCLTERERGMLDMKYLDRLSDREIAEVLKIPTGNVRVYLLRIRKKLKKLLEEQEDE